MILTSEHAERLADLDFEDSQDRLLASGLLQIPERSLLDDKFEKIIEESVWDTDPVRVNEKSQLATKIGFYGKPMEGADEIYAEALAVYARSQRNQGKEVPDQIPNIALTSAFKRLRQIGTGLSDAQYLLIQQMVLKEASHEVLAALNLKPTDIDLVLNATSIPIQENFHQLWASAIGIEQNGNMPQLIRLCLACDSSAHGVNLVRQGTFDHYIRRHNPDLDRGKPARIMLAALDDANRLSDKGGDYHSPQLFTTGFGIVIFTYHPDSEEPNTFKTIVHQHASIEDGTKFLLVPRPYDTWTDKADLYTAEHLKSPPHSGPIEMHVRAGVVFKRYALRLTKEVLAQYQEKGFNFQQIKRVIMHHPSGEIFKDIKEELIKIGFQDDQIAWVIPEGNVPVGTYPISWSRQIGSLEIEGATGRQKEGLQPGDHVLEIFYGAGGKYDVSIVEMGQAA